jgi:hypothetical protein
VLDPWRRFNFSIAARGAILALLLIAWGRIDQGSEDARSDAEAPTGETSTAMIRITAATASARPGQHVGVLVEYPLSGQAADVVLLADGRPVRRETVPANGRIGLPFLTPASGPVILGAELRDSASDELIAKHEDAILLNVLERLSILVIANRPSAFAQSLRQGGWPVSELRSGDIGDRRELFASRSLLILDDVAADDLSADTWATIDDAVRRQAMGLLVLGGPRSFGPGGYRGSMLEGLLPLVSEPPESEPPASVMFLIDVSGSMGRPGAVGDRLQIAQQAVIETARTLRPVDHVGLMSFSVDTVEHLPLTARSDHSVAVTEAWPGVPGGGTQLAAAISAALDRLMNDAIDEKILIVLTDGRIADDELATLARSLPTASAKILALLIDAEPGQDDLARLVDSSGGQAVAVGNLLRLPSLMRSQLEEIRPAFVPGPIGARTVDSVSWLPFAAWPPVGGYLLTRPKSHAVVHLESVKGDPLIASASAGAGAVVAVTSGFSGWAREWLRSGDWPALAGALTRRLATRDVSPFELAIDLDRQLLTIAVHADQSANLPVASLTTPPGVTVPVELDRHAPGQLAGHLPLDTGGTYLAVAGTASESMRRRFIYHPPDATGPSTDIDASTDARVLPRMLWLAIALAAFLGVLWWERRPSQRDGQPRATVSSNPREASSTRSSTRSNPAAPP